MQPRHRATLTQPLIQCNLQRLSCKTQKNYAQRRRQLQLQNRISTPKQKKKDFEALFKRIYTRKITSAKIAKICWQINIAGCSHSNTIYDVQLQKTIVLRMNPRHRATLTQPLQCDLQAQEQPLVAKHIGGTIRDRNNLSCNRRTEEVPFIASCSHFTGKNTRCRAPASSPTQAPCNIHAGQFFCDVLLCSKKSHTTLHQGLFSCDVLLCSVKSRTTLHQGRFFCDVLLCSVKYHTTLHQVKVIRN